MDNSNLVREFKKSIGRTKYTTVLADPPWQFTNRTGKMEQEHKRQH